MSSSSSGNAVTDGRAERPTSASRLRLAARKGTPGDWGQAWALLLAFPSAWLLGFLIIPVVVVLVVSFFCQGLWSEQRRARQHK